MRKTMNLVSVLVGSVALAATGTAFAQEQDRTTIHVEGDDQTVTIEQGEDTVILEEGAEQPVEQQDRTMMPEQQQAPIAEQEPLEPEPIEEEPIVIEEEERDVYVDQDIDVYDDRDQATFTMEDDQATVETEEGRFGTTLIRDIGIVAGVGGFQFTSGSMNDFTDVGGLWQVRAIINPTERFSAEAAYVGTAQDIDAIGLDSDAYLLGTMFEANGKLGIGTWSGITPYGLAGIGFTRFSLQNQDFNTSSVNNSDNMLHFPFGVGASWSSGNLLVDARGTFRYTLDDELVPLTAAGDEPSQHSLDISANVGFRF